MDITIPPGETATIWLPGAAAIRIDARHRVIAVDTVSTNFADGEPLGPEWLVQDLRIGCYGDFHQLKPAAECFDSTCAGQGGEHATAEDRAAFAARLHQSIDEGERAMADGAPMVTIDEVMAEDEFS